MKYAEVVRKLDRGYKLARRDHFEQEFFANHRNELPDGLVDAIRLRFGDDLTADEHTAHEQIERRRADLESMDSGVSIYYSPSPKEVDDPTQPGEEQIFEPEKIARTGVDPNSGLFLRRVIESRGCSRILEMGSCAGISAAYMAGADECDHLDTIEASDELAELARETITLVHDDFVVHANLFDEYLDQIEDTNTVFDLAYIDGQHERQSTLRYFDRVADHLRPGSVVIFDDIYWSEDMNQCWQNIQQLDSLSYTIDVGKFGVCIYGPNGPSTHINATEYFGRPKIGSPDW